MRNAVLRRDALIRASSFVCIVPCVVPTCRLLACFRLNKINYWATRGREEIYDKKTQHTIFVHVTSGKDRAYDKSDLKESQPWPQQRRGLQKHKALLIDLQGTMGQPELMLLPPPDLAFDFLHAQFGTG